VNPGDRYGSYHIVRLIGRGAMGDVFLAHHTQANRTVALKIVYKGNDADSLEIVEAERLGAELQKRLRGVDPRVVTVNDYGEIGGDLFIEMEFIEGEDISALISRGPVGVGFAVHVARELCEMLENLRTFTTTIGEKRFAGIVHGDLKPGNVRIDRQNRVKVLDFGIAKALTHTRKYTMNVFASTAYCSPERIESQNMDTRSDLWSVGVLLYQMIAHALPFDETSKERLERRIRSGQPPNPLPSFCPEPLQRIIFKMLAQDAAQRYQAPIEASEDLERFQNGQRVLAEAYRPADGFDNDATVRTSPPASTRVLDDRTVRSAVVTTPSVTVPKRSNKLLGCLTSFAAACLTIFVFCTVQVNFWDAADTLKTDLQAERITNLDQAWTEYQSLNKRPHIPVFLWGAERALKNRLVAAADETISEYRNSDAPSVYEPQWVQARNNLARALELNPGDNKIRGRLRLCEAHIDRIDANALRGPARQKLFNAAINKFYESAELAGRSPDAYLGLANIYIYDLGDVDRAEDALNKAANYGHAMGSRETAQLADGYLHRGDRMWRQSHSVTGMRDQEREYLDKAKHDYLRAENLYKRAGLFGGAPRNRLQALQSQQRVEQRLLALESGSVSQ
jgi:serine/threonine protein kinase